MAGLIIVPIVGGTFVTGMIFSSSIVTLPDELGLQTLITIGLSLLVAFGVSAAALAACPDKSGEIFNEVPAYMVGAF